MMFGERLKLARKREGLSLQELAARVDGIVSARTISKYERGAVMPGSTVLIALSRTLDISIDYLLSPSDVSLKDLEFRKLASAGARERAMVEVAVLDHVDRYLQVEELLGISNGQGVTSEGAAYRIRTMDDAERAATAVRAAWNLGGNAISNMTELLEERGIKVLKLDFPLSVDGLTCNARRPGREDVPIIVCTTRQPVECQRFTLAHELGHMLLDTPDGVNREKACNRFAGAFLVPKQELFDEVGYKRHAFGCAELIEIKKIFGIKAAALVVRLRDLGIIGNATLRGVFNGVGRTWKNAEPFPLQRDEPAMRFQRLCYRALAEEIISRSKAAELLGLPINEIEQIMLGSAGG